MPDVLTKEQRQRNMSGIRGRDTKPEMLVRRGLYVRGLRYKLHDKALPGRPDLVFPRYHAVVFVHGCFWHAHDCPMYKQPTTRKAFWSDKLKKNADRDRTVLDKLQSSGWRVLIIWECATRGPCRLNFQQVMDEAERFIKEEDAKLLVIEGKRL